jgi:hypothetical protein
MPNTQQLGDLASEKLLLWHIASGKYLLWQPDGASLSASAHHLSPDGSIDQCVCTLQTIDRTLGTAMAGAFGVNYGDYLWICSSAHTSHAGLHMCAGDEMINKGGVDLLPVKVSLQATTEDALQLRRADTWLARAVLHASTISGALGAVASRLVQCAGYSRE